MAEGRTYAEAVVQFVAKGKVAFTSTMKKVIIQSMLQQPKREVVGFAYASASIRGPGGTGLADLSGGTLSAASEASP
jgi:hypothetical protein